MNIPEKPSKAVVSVVEMAELCRLSRSRFYSLMQSGIFPKPIRNDACKRPVFDHDLQQKCLDIRRTGVGANGQPVVFNRRRKNNGSKQKPKPKTGANDHSSLNEALKSLGLQASAETVEEALRELYPDGRDQIDEAEQVRQVFLHLQRKK